VRKDVRGKGVNGGSGGRGHKRCEEREKRGEREGQEERREGELSIGTLLEPGSREVQDAKVLDWGVMRGPRLEKERTPLLEMAP
jgi:hypothetical protein